MSVGIAIIGCGAIAQRRHIPETMNHPEARLVALVDINKSRVRQLCDETGATPYTDYKRMLLNPEVDAVVVATPNIYHTSHVLDSFAAGKHVMVEKPMATTRTDAKAMMRAGNRAKKLLMVAQNQRLMPPHVKAKEILDSGKLGKVLSFRTTFQHPGPEGWSVDGPRSWFFDPKIAVMGVCGDLGVHKADLMRYLLGEEIVEVAGFLATRHKKNGRGGPLPLDDNAFFTMKTQSGVVGTMTISWTNYGRLEDNSTHLFCENGVLLLGSDPKYGVVIRHRSGEVENIKTGAIATNTRQVLSGLMKLFVKAIQTNTQPMIDGAEGYRSLDVILGCIESANARKTVRLKGI